jgi:hypothetical protein
MTIMNCYCIVGAGIEVTAIVETDVCAAAAINFQPIGKLTQCIEVRRAVKNDGTMKFGMGTAADINTAVSG